MGAQHLLASEMGPMTMRNVPVRLVGRVADTTAGYQAAGRGEVGAESLRGRGDFVVVTGSQVRHFQVAYVSESLLRAWERRYPPRPPAVPVTNAPGAGRAASTHSQASTSVLGRPQDEIPPEVLALITAYADDHGQAPSNNWVYQRTKELLPGGGYSRAKARRAIVLATENTSLAATTQGEDDGQADS